MREIKSHLASLLDQILSTGPRAGLAIKRLASHGSKSSRTSTGYRAKAFLRGCGVRGWSFRDGQAGTRGGGFGGGVWSLPIDHSELFEISMDSRAAALGLRRRWPRPSVDHSSYIFYHSSSPTSAPSRPREEPRFIWFAATQHWKL